MKIGIIVGSIRQGRAGSAVAKFVAEQAEGRENEYEVIELADFNVPLLTSNTLPGMANKQYETPEVTAWSAAIDECDAYVFVTAEYNHGIPGAFKNAVDSLGSEWNGKAVAFVSYGAAGGFRAVEHWRPVVANFSMFDVRAQVDFNLFVDWKDGVFAPGERKAGEIAGMLNQLEQAAYRMID